MRTLLSIFLWLLLPVMVWGQNPYTIPSDRTIAWYPAGMDVIGGVPSGGWAQCVTAACNTVSGGTVTATSLNSAITSASANTYILIPAGTWTIATTAISMKSNVELRGAKVPAAPWMPTADAAATTLSLTGGAKIYFNGGSKAANWTPAADSGRAITSGYTLGSTSLTIASGTAFATDDYIAIYQNNDSAISDFRAATYLGEDCGACSDPHVLQQYSKVTAVSGNCATGACTLTINPSVYYVSPAPTGQSVRKQTFGVVNAGLQNLRIDGNGLPTPGIIQFEFTRNCWVKSVESYNADNNSSGSAHIWTRFSYANEYRDSYFHHGASRDSGRNYGIEFYNWNARHKIENNILRDVRHSLANEGGNAASVFLYNYTDDNGESVQGAGGTPDTSFLGEDEMGNHGSHPHHNLYEGNNATSYWGDYTQGSSSHNTAFRNYIRCKNTVQSLDASPWLWTCVEVEYYNRYYNIVGNIIGLPAFTAGTRIQNAAGDPTKPVIFRFGFSSAGGTYQDGISRSTAILQGNYDYVSDSQADWDGGATNTVFANSLYYAAKPAWYGGYTWPPVDASTHTASVIPAVDRYNNVAPPGATTYTLSTATTGTGTGTVTGCAGTHSSPYFYSCTVTATTGSLTSVTGCNGSGTTTYTGTMTGDCTVTATFTAITPPVVSLTAPSANSSISGTVSVTASCSADSGACAGVQFTLDGANLGVEDTASPFAISWDTAGLISGSSHVLSCTARDSTGNTANCSNVTVTVMAGGTVQVCAELRFLVGGSTAGSAPLTVNGSSAGSRITINGVSLL